jgi:hypothetical protein
VCGRGSRQHAVTWVLGFGVAPRTHTGVLRLADGGSFAAQRAPEGRPVVLGLERAEDHRGGVPSGAARVGEPIEIMTFATARGLGYQRSTGVGRR